MLKKTLSLMGTLLLWALLVALLVPVGLLVSLYVFLKLGFI